MHTLPCAKYSGTNPRIALQHLKAIQLMPNFPHPVRCCTTARYVPPYHLRSAILTQQPYRFKSTLSTKLSMPSPMLTSASSNLHNSMLVSQLQHLTSWGKSGYLLQLFLSFQRTATKYTLQMEPSITVPDATTGKQCQMQWCWAQGPISHIGTGSHQVSQTYATTCHNHSKNTTISCTCDPRTKYCCPSFYTYSHAKGHPSAYAHLYTECSTCVTTKVRLCPHSTKMPDHRDVTEEVTAPGPMNDALDLECPWIMLAICALRCWTISLAQAP